MRPACIHSRFMVSYTSIQGCSMYDDYDFDFAYTSEYGDLETYDNLDLDEDYSRESNDYQEMAYRHYA